MSSRSALRNDIGTTDWLTSTPCCRIAEKFLEWTDEDPPIDLILESVTLYWLTDCASTSLWPYRQVRVLAPLHFRFFMSTPLLKTIFVP
jgi:hypothetical protein